METVETIKSLYKSFKASTGVKRSEYSKLYTEAVENEFKNNKKNIISSPYLEYIVSSSTGMNLLNSFLEKYGLPICDFEKFYSTIDNKRKSIDQKGVLNKNRDKEIMFESYSELLSKLDVFRERWENAFIMFDKFKKKGINYSSIYFENVLNGAKTPLKFLSQYGESVIPDLMIGASFAKQNRVFYEGLINNPTFFNRKLGQWVFEAAKNSVGKKNIVKKLYSLSLEPLMAQLERKEIISLCESILNTTFIPNGLKTKANLNLINDYIEIKSCLVESSSFPENCLDSIKQIDKANELRTNLEDSAEIVTSYLQTPVVEGLFDQTGEKRTGDIPDYIKKNYNTDYDDDESNKEVDEPDANELSTSSSSMDAYRRTSSSSQSTDDEDDTDTSTDDEIDSSSDSAKKGNINYYYYNYTNSFNRHNDSSVNYSDNKDYSNNTISQHGNVSYTKADKTGNNWEGNTNTEIDAKDSSNSSIGRHHDALKQEIKKAIDGIKKNNNGLKESYSITTLESVHFFIEGESDSTSSVSSSSQKIDTRPESDNPLRDQINDVKKAGQKVGDFFKTVGQGINDTVFKPVGKIKDWAIGMLQAWKQKTENEKKEDLADPRRCWTLWRVIRNLFYFGLIVAAGPLVWALATYGGIKGLINASGDKARLLREMEHEIPTEIGIIEKKIERARDAKNHKRADELERVKSNLQNMLDNIKGKNAIIQ